ncbi:hypothetical protein [Methylobacterium sp. J-076]|uniref:hypothetical protein n=1 Tax=Methylobacterium sp. J-076 TaxID=2836655 RepID=UPI001FBAA781|nr:hypothetical protein [Methylobacterium sp. J-076]MCJ2011839.1 hypothetical protein [Methylobacterium sp. J-076]
MRPARLFPLLLFCAAPAAALPLRGPAVTDAVYVRPLYGGPYRHCGGECVKSGSLSWFCAARAQCVLNCAIAPPSRKCATP